VNARLKAALPATFALGKFLWQNRKVELAIGGAIVSGVVEIARALSGHA
jgi:hypothetical protein